MPKEHLVNPSAPADPAPRNEYLCLSIFNQLILTGLYILYHLFPEDCCLLQNAHTFIDLLTDLAKSQRNILGVRAALWHSVHMRHIQMLYKYCFPSCTSSLCNLTGVFMWIHGNSLSDNTHFACYCIIYYLAVYQSSS